MQGRLEDKEDEGLGRGATRRKMFLAATAAQTEAQCLVEVFNISESGLLLGTSGTLDLDEPVTVVLPGVGERTARIVWSSQNLYGCRFDEPLSKGEVSASLLRSEPEPPAPVARTLIDAEPRETFGARVKRLRTASRYSMIELAEKVGVSKPTLWKWETDKVRPREAAVRALADVFGMTPAELLYGRGEQSFEQPGRHVPESGGAASGSLADVIARSKQDIARAAGAKSTQVAITIEWS